jgi:hypothetical protein
MGQLPHQIGEYGKLVYSPTESPETPEEYAAFATSSLIEYGAKAHNHEAVSKLKQANLQGKGAVVPLDFPEVGDPVYPGERVIYIINNASTSDSRSKPA